MTTVTRQVHFAYQDRRKVAMQGLAPDTRSPDGRVPRISKLMALAIRFDKLLIDGVIPDLAELSRLARVTQPRITQIMNLLHLAPDIQEDILCFPLVKVGNDPITERDLRPITQIREWPQQRSMWRALRNDTQHP